MRECRLCQQPHSRGIHYDVYDAATGECVRSYDVCAACMNARSPLILPRPVPGTTQQFRVAFESFGTPPSAN